MPPWPSVEPGNFSKDQVEQLRECWERWKGVGFLYFAAMFANSRRSLVRAPRLDGGAAAIFSNKKQTMANHRRLL
jgi:hypothetical protein